MLILIFEDFFGSAVLHGAYKYHTEYVVVSWHPMSTNRAMCWSGIKSICKAARAI